jgi:Fe-S-cluster containining protein
MPTSSTKRSSSSRSAPPIPALLDELRQLYAEVDAQYAGVTCPGSTECCRFGVTGRQPYLTSIEAALIRRALAERGFAARKLPRFKPLPLATEHARDERPCPLLDDAGRCSVYASRPFGCRTFYCGRATGELPARRELRALLQRLQALAARHESGGDRARPLQRIFAASSG